MDGQGTTWRRNNAENFNRLSRVHQRYRRQTDDRQTDGPSMTNSEHELEFTFAKNGIRASLLVYPFYIISYFTLLWVTDILWRVVVRCVNNNFRYKRPYTKWIVVRVLDLVCLVLAQWIFLVRSNKRR